MRKKNQCAILDVYDVSVRYAVCLNESSVCKFYVPQQQQNPYACRYCRFGNCTCKAAKEDAALSAIKHIKRKYLKNHDL